MEQSKSSSVIASNLVIGPIKINSPTAINVVSENDAQLTRQFGGNYTPTTVFSGRKIVRLTIQVPANETEYISQIHQTISNLGGLVPIRSAELMELVLPYDSNPGIYMGIGTNVIKHHLNSKTYHPDIDDVANPEELETRLNETFKRQLSGEDYFDGTLIDFIQIHSSPIYNVINASTTIQDNMTYLILMVEPTSFGNDSAIKYLTNDDALFHQELFFRMYKKYGAGDVTIGESNFIKNWIQFNGMLDDDDKVTRDVLQSHILNTVGNIGNHNNQAKLLTNAISESSLKFKKEPIIKSAQISTNTIMLTNNNQFVIEGDIYEQTTEDDKDALTISYINDISNVITYEDSKGNPSTVNSKDTIDKSYLNIRIDGSYNADDVYVADGDTVNMKLNKTLAELTKDTIVDIRILGIDTYETLKLSRVHQGASSSTLDPIQIVWDSRFNHYATRVDEYMAIASKTYDSFATSFYKEKHNLDYNIPEDKKVIDEMAKECPIFEYWGKERPSDLSGINGALQKINKYMNEKQDESKIKELQASMKKVPTMFALATIAKHIYKGIVDKAINTKDDSFYVDIALSRNTQNLYLNKEGTGNRYMGLCSFSFKDGDETKTFSLSTLFSYLGLGLTGKVGGGNDTDNRFNEYKQYFHINYNFTLNGKKCVQFIIYNKDRTVKILDHKIFYDEVLAPYVTSSLNTENYVTDNQTPIKITSIDNVVPKDIYIKLTDKLGNVHPISYQSYNDKDIEQLQKFAEFVSDKFVKKNKQYISNVEFEISDNKKLGYLIEYNGLKYFVVPNYFVIYNNGYIHESQYIDRTIGANKLYSKTNGTVLQHNINTMGNVYNIMRGFTEDELKNRTTGNTIKTALTKAQLLEAFTNIDNLTASLMTADTYDATKGYGLFEYLKEELAKNTSVDDLFMNDVDDLTVLNELANYIVENSTIYPELSEPFRKYCGCLSEEHYRTTQNDNIFINANPNVKESERNTKESKQELEYVNFNQTYPVIECGYTTYSVPQKLNENDLYIKYLATNLNTGDAVSMATEAVIQYLSETHQSTTERPTVNPFISLANLLFNEKASATIQNLDKDYHGLSDVDNLDVYTAFNLPVKYDKIYKLFDNEIDFIKNLDSVANPKLLKIIINQNTPKEALVQKHNEAYITLRDIANRLFTELPFKLYDTRNGLKTKKNRSKDSYSQFVDSKSNLLDKKIQIKMKNTKSENPITMGSQWYFINTNFKENTHYEWDYEDQLKVHDLPVDISTNIKKKDDHKKVFLDEFISRTIKAISFIQAVADLTIPANSRGENSRYMQVTSVINEALTTFTDTLKYIFTEDVIRMIDGKYMNEAVSELFDNSSFVITDSCDDPASVFEAINASLIKKILEQLYYAINNLGFDLYPLLDLNPIQKKTIALVNSTKTNIDTITINYNSNNPKLKKNDLGEGYKYQHMGSSTETALIRLKTKDVTLWKTLLYIHETQLEVNRDWLMIKRNSAIQRAKFGLSTTEDYINNNKDVLSSKGASILKTSLQLNEKFTNLNNVSLDLINPFLNQFGFKYGILTSISLESDPNEVGEAIIRLEVAKTTNKLNPLLLPKNYNKVVANSAVANTLIMRGRQYISRDPSEHDNINILDNPLDLNTIFVRSSEVAYAGAMQATTSIAILGAVLKEIMLDKELQGILYYDSFKSEAIKKGFKEVNNTTTNLYLFSDVDSVEAMIMALALSNSSEIYSIIYRLYDILSGDVTFLDQIRKKIDVENSTTTSNNAIAVKIKNYIETKYQDILALMGIEMKGTEAANIYNIFMTFLQDMMKLYNTNTSWFSSYILYFFLLNKYKDSYAVLDQVVTYHTKKDGSKYSSFDNDWLALRQNLYKIYALDGVDFTNETGENSAFSSYRDYQNFIIDSLDSYEKVSGTDEVFKTSLNQYKESDGTEHTYNFYHTKLQQSSNQKYEYINFKYEVKYTANLLRFLTTMYTMYVSNGILTYEDFLLELKKPDFNNFILKLNENIEALGFYHDNDRKLENVNKTELKTDLLYKRKFESYKNRNTKDNSLLSRMISFTKTIFTLIKPIIPISTTFDKIVTTRTSSTDNNDISNYVKVLFDLTKEADIINCMLPIGNQKEPLIKYPYRINGSGKYKNSTFEYIHQIAFNFRSVMNGFSIDSNIDDAKLKERYSENRVQIRYNDKVDYANIVNNNSGTYFTNVTNVRKYKDGSQSSIELMLTQLSRLAMTNANMFNEMSSVFGPTNSDNNNNPAERSDNGRNSLIQLPRNRTLLELMYYNPLGIGHLLVSQLTKKIYTQDILPIIFNKGYTFKPKYQLTDDTTTIVASSQKFGMYNSDNSPTIGLGYLSQNNLPMVQLFNNERLIQFANNSPFVLNYTCYNIINNMLRELKINSSPTFFTLYSNMINYQNAIIDRTEANLDMISQFQDTLLSGSLIDDANSDQIDIGTNLLDNKSRGYNWSRYSYKRILEQVDTYYQQMNTILSDLDFAVKKVYGLLRQSNKMNGINFIDLNSTYALEIDTLFTMIQKQIYISESLGDNVRKEQNRSIRDRLVTKLNKYNDSKEFEKLKIKLNEIQKIDPSIKGDVTNESFSTFKEMINNVSVQDLINNMFTYEPDEQIYMNYNYTQLETEYNRLSDNITKLTNRLYQTVMEQFTSDRGTNQQYVALISNALNEMLTKIQTLSLIFYKYFKYNSVKTTLETVQNNVLFTILTNPMDNEFADILNSLYGEEDSTRMIDNSLFDYHTSQAIRNKREKQIAMIHPNDWNKAYPTQKVLFYQDAIAGLMTFEDIFSFANISQIAVSSDARHPVTSAMMIVNDPYNTLTNIFDKENLGNNSRLSPLELSPSYTEYISSFFLTEGTNVQIRMGYGNYLEDDTIVFNGKITSIVPAEDVNSGVLQVNAINYGSSLTNDAFDRTVEIYPVPKISPFTLFNYTQFTVYHRYIMALNILKPNAFYTLDGAEKYDSVDADPNNGEQSSLNEAITKYKADKSIPFTKDYMPFILSYNKYSDIRNLVQNYLGVANLVPLTESTLFNNINIKRYETSINEGNAVGTGATMFLEGLMHSQKYIASIGETPWDVLYSLHMHLPNHIITIRPVDLKETIIIKENTDYYKRQTYSNAGSINFSALKTILNSHVSKNLKSVDSYQRMIKKVTNDFDKLLNKKETSLTQSELQKMYFYNDLLYYIYNLTNNNNVKTKIFSRRNYNNLDTSIRNEMTNILYVFKPYYLNDVYLNDDAFKGIDNILKSEFVVVHADQDTIENNETYKQIRNINVDLYNKVKQIIIDNIDNSDFNGQEIVDSIKKDYIKDTMHFSVSTNTAFINKIFDEYKVIIFNAQQQYKKFKDKKFRILDSMSAYKQFIKQLEYYLIALDPNYRLVKETHYIFNDNILNNSITVSDNANTVILSHKPMDDQVSAIMNNIGAMVKNNRTNPNWFVKFIGSLAEGMSNPLGVQVLLDNAFGNNTIHTLNRSDLYVTTTYPFEPTILEKNRKLYITKDPNVNMVFDIGIEEADVYANKTMTNILKEYYSGRILIEGRPDMFTLDDIVIEDYKNNMFGIAEIRVITHVFSADTGYITSIEPSMKVVEPELSKHDMGLMAGRLLMSALTIWQLVPSIGSLSAASSAIKSGNALGAFKASAKSELTNLIQTRNILSPVTFKGGKFGLQKGFNPFNTGFGLILKATGLDNPRLKTLVKDGAKKGGTIYNIIKKVFTRQTKHASNVKLTKEQENEIVKNLTTLLKHELPDISDTELRKYIGKFLNDKNTVKTLSSAAESKIPDLLSRFVKKQISDLKTKVQGRARVQGRNLEKQNNLIDKMIKKIVGSDDKPGNALLKQKVMDVLTSDDTPTDAILYLKEVGADTVEVLTEAPNNNKDFVTRIDLSEFKEQFMKELPGNLKNNPNLISKYDEEIFAKVQKALQNNHNKVNDIVALYTKDVALISKVTSKIPTKENIVTNLFAAVTRGNARLAALVPIATKHLLMKNLILDPMRNITYNIYSSNKNVYQHIIPLRHKGETMVPNMKGVKKSTSTDFSTAGNKFAYLQFRTILAFKKAIGMYDNSQ